MPENPASGEAFRKAVPREENPRRPLVTDDLHEKLLAKPGDVHPLLPVIESGRPTNCRTKG